MESLVASIRASDSNLQTIEAALEVDDHILDQLYAYASKTISLKQLSEDYEVQNLIRQVQEYRGTSTETIGRTELKEIVLDPLIARYLNSSPDSADLDRRQIIQYVVDDLSDPISVVKHKLGEFRTGHSKLIKAGVAVILFEGRYVASVTCWIYRHKGYVVVQMFGIYSSILNQLTREHRHLAETLIETIKKWSESESPDYYAVWHPRGPMREILKDAGFLIKDPDEFLNGIYYLPLVQGIPEELPWPDKPNAKFPLT